MHIHFCLQLGHWAALSQVYNHHGKASPVLFVCFCSDCVYKEYGGCRRLYMSLHLLWVLAHSFHKYSLSNAGDRMLCLYNHCFLLRLKPSQHISVQEALLRRSLFLTSLRHGLWVTAQHGEFLEKDPTSVRANFRQTYFKLECSSFTPNFLQFSRQLALSLPALTADPHDQQTVSVKPCCSDWWESIQAGRSKSKNKEGCTSYFSITISLCIFTPTQLST